MKSKPTVNTSPKPAEAQGNFRDMSSGEKLRFVAKSLLFVLTMGFVFPTLWVD